MIRILQAVNDMRRAGLETILMNYYRNTDRTQIQFDFLTTRPYKSDYDDEILSMGGRVYYAPRLYPQNYPKYFAYMKKFFYEHPEYKIVHSHIDAMSYLPLIAAKKAGVPIRIAHSHNTGIDKDFKYPLKQFFRKKITSAANVYLACGSRAGEFLFENKSFEVIPNAVEVEKFYFDSAARERKRTELGLASEFTVGHVGRLSYQKNHIFLIDIFKELHEKEKNSALLLVGTGEREREISAYIKKCGLENVVKMLGNRNDVNELYQAMDVFALPSMFEGVPVVGVEAQIADLPCFFSDKVPNEVKFNETAEFIPLDSGARHWADALLSAKNKTTGRDSSKSCIKSSRYDIKKTKSILTDLYCDLLENIDKFENI